VNILVVTPFQISAIGGVSTAVKMLYNEFKNQNHAVNVLVPGDCNEVCSVETVDDYGVYSVNLRAPVVRSRRIRGFCAFCMFFPVTLYRLYKFVGSRNVDIVAIQYPLSSLIYFAILRFVCRWGLFITLQGNDVHNLPLENSFERYLVRVLLVAADCVVAVSRSLLDEVKRVFPGLSIESCIVPNGTPPHLARVSAVDLGNKIPQEYILTVGQLVYRKGIDVLVRAMKIARAKGCFLNLVVVGDGVERSNLLGIAESAGLAENVFFLGNQHHEVVLQLMSTCQFFVLASRAEGLPLVITEAMVCGKAVVATDVDGIPEIIEDGKNGLLVRSDDEQSLANALVRLHVDTRLRTMLGSRGRERVLGSYTWEAIATQYLETFTVKLRELNRR